ncbi:MAG: PDZ domain-containing protein, partial [Nanoarchaeota archaeon]
MIKLSWKIWLLIGVLMGAALLIGFNFEKGVIIKSVEKNSTAFDTGLRTGSIIKSINGKIVNNVQDYQDIINSIFPVENSTKLIITTKDSEFILFSDQSPLITVADIPKTKIKTGLDLSGGARALVKAENKS